MTKDWRIYALKADFNELARKFNIDPVVARILRNRGLQTDEEYENYLYGTLDSVHEPESMLDIELGADIIIDVISAGRSIRIVGDYDVDGVMSTYILYDAFKNLGADVSYDIPHRVRDGYGINERIVDDAYADGVELIVTCDNGISAVDAVNKAVEYGMNVVITDHHEIPPVLPEADAIIDPHQPGDGYPFKEICGAVVAYKLVQVIYRQMDIELDRNKYLEALAAATVCDVMPLKDENRIFVREGFRKLENTDNLGFRELLKACSLEGKTIVGYNMGFMIGPCINAMGKLGDAKDALELFITEDPDFAEKRAKLLWETNQSRKGETDEGEEKAIAEISKEADEDGRPKDSVLVVYVKGLREGLAGIVAGRIKEKYYRPTIVFTDTDGDEMLLKGSGRSIEAYNMYEKINEHRDMCVKFGGHPMAAGLSIKREDLDNFREQLNADSGLSEQDMIPKLMIDVPMPLSYATLKLAEQLESLEPFGKGNEDPLFAEKNLEILGYNYGRNSNKILFVKVRSANKGIYTMKTFRPKDFLENINKWFTPEECAKIEKGIYSGCKLDIAYTLSINDFRGSRTLEFFIKEYDKSN